MQDLVASIRERHSQNESFLAILERSMIAVNNEYVYELASVNLNGTEEIAVIPPISGG